MNFPECMSLIAGGLQFMVAGYALRLNRLFGTSRVGWSLFGAFSLLAVLHLVQSIAQFDGVAQFGVRIEVIYSLISLLLLTGMTHIEALLKERLLMEQKELKLKAELESQVKEKTAHLTKAIEELQLEVEERKRMEGQVEKTHQKLLVASRQAGMAEIATSVLHNVGNMLQSVNVSASLVFDQMKQSKIANIVRVGSLIREHEADLGKFMKNDPRGQKLPVYIAQLADHLTNEQSVLSKELESLRTNINEVLAIQQGYVKISNVTDKVKNDAISGTQLHLDDDFLAKCETHNFNLNRTR
jgi:C4-dicarboxylate-specific signal transduction histidine kinase